MTYIRSRKHTGLGFALHPIAAGAVAGAALMLAAAPALADAAADAADAADGATVSSVDVNTKPTYKEEQSANVKATASVLDTPQTVQIIGETLIREQGATTLTEALQNSAGVGTFFLGENGNTNTGDAIFIRGSDVSGAILIDGVRDVGSVFRDVFNIEQVEVLKGGAGADIGRGAATGSIGIYTKQPKADDFQSGSIAYGGGDFKRATADVNWAMTDRLGLRLNLMIQDSGVPGRDRIQNNRWGVAPSLGFKLGEATQIYVNYLHSEQDNIPDGGVFVIGLPGYTSPDAARPFITTAPRVDPSNFYGTNDDHDDVTIDSGTLIIEYTINDNFSVRNLTRSAKTDQEYQLSSFMGATAQLLTPNPADRSTWTITRNINNKNVTNKILFNQTNFRLNFATGSWRHNISAGLELVGEEQRNRTYVGAGAYTPVNVYNPNPNATGYSRSLSGAYTLGSTDTVGLYFNDTVTITEQLLLNVGVRMDSYKTTFDSVTAANVKTTLTAKDDLVSGRIGLVWKPIPSASLYTSYATTEQPPGGANFSLSATTSANVNNPNVEPQSSKSSEIGGKWDVLKNHLSLTAALYQTEYSDQILTDGSGGYYRAGAKTIKGVELGAIGQITPAWALSLGYSKMDTKVESPIGTVVVADGSTDLAYSPTDSFTLWTTYRIGEKITLGGGARYNGKIKRGTDGAVGTPKYADGYWALNAVASYRITRNIEAQLNVYNLLDEEYVAAINKSGYRYTPGAPRNARLTLNFNF